MRKILLISALFVCQHLAAINIPILLFSYSTGWVGTISTSNGLNNGYTLSNYGIKNIYFTNTNDVSVVSNNIWATCVFEYTNGTEQSIDGFIYSRATTGNNIDGLMWTPNSSYYTAPASTSIGIGTTVSLTANSAVCVQYFGRTVSTQGNSQGSYVVGGNSGNITMAQLQSYAASYPNTTTALSSNVSSTGVTWGGSKLSSSASFSISEAGVYYATVPEVNIGVANATYQTMSFANSSAQVDFNGTISSLTANTTYYYRAYLKVGTAYYQGPLESFKTCPAAPVGTGATICSGATAALSATGVAGGTLTWHTAANGGTQLGTGAIFTTAALTNSTSANATQIYYAQDNNNATTSCPSPRTAVTVTIKPVTSVVNVCQSLTTCAKNSTTSLPANTVQSGGGSYTWYANSTPSNQNGTLVGNTSSSQSIPTSTAAVSYYYYTLNDGCGTITSPVQEVVVYDNKWLGTTSNAWSVGSNWSAGTAPSVTEIIVIPASVSTFPTIGDLTISSTGAIVLEDNAQFTLTGTMTNNGKFIVNSGATFVYTATTPFASNDTGEYIFRQDAAGKSALFGGLYQPVGRYWYMGVPFQQARSVFGTAISSVEANGPSSSKVWGWNEQGGAVWSEITNQAQTLNPAVGYLVRLGGSCKNLNFSTTTAPYTAEINNAVSRTTGSNSLDGFNLVANPFPAYIDAVAMKNASTNISNTMWYRTFNSSNNQMVFDNFQTNAPSSSIINSNAGHTTTQLQKIPPYQAFWVRVQGGNGSTGNVKMNRTMLTHESNGMHLKSSSEFKAFVRMNLSQGTKTDQFVVYLDEPFTSGYDAYDGEKMFVSGMPQVYTKTGSYKLAIQSVQSDQSKTSIPISIEIPAPTMYQFDFVEDHIQNGKIFLEDKKIGVYIDLDLDTAYTFFSTTGTIHDRFVLHFMRKVIGAADPTIVDDWAAPEIGQTNDIAIKNLANQTLEVSRPIAHLHNGQITVFDYSGKLVNQMPFTTSQQQFSIANGPGIYMIIVESEGQTTSKKVLIF